MLTISDCAPQNCEEFLEDMEKEFRKVNKAQDIHSPQECEAAVKKKMSECRLRLEAARFEAEKVVTRLLKDHEAWGHVSKEGRLCGKAADDRPGSREQKEMESDVAASQQVRFGDETRRESGVTSAGVGEE